MNIYSTQPSGFYVYVYFKIDNNKAIPYYVGKGQNKRAWGYHNYAPAPEDLSLIVIAESNLSEVGAYAIERRLIKYYGRVDKGTGTLLNRTDGGPGGSNPRDESAQLRIQSRANTIARQSWVKLSKGRYYFKKR